MAAEHVATHDRRPDIRELLFENRRARVHDAARHAVLRAPRRRLNDPLVQPLTADPEGVVHALVRAGDETVERHGDAEAQPGHLTRLFRVASSDEADLWRWPCDP